MGLSPVELEESVLSRLKELFPKTVYEDAIPDDGSLEYDSRGTLVPFAIVEWGDLSRSATDRGLVSVRQDTYVYFFTVSVVTSRSEDTKQLMGHVTDGLIGFRPENGGEVTPRGSMNFSRSSTTVRPTQFIRSATFQCITNLQWEL